MIISRELHLQGLDPSILQSTPFPLPSPRIHPFPPPTPPQTFPPSRTLSNPPPPLCTSPFSPPPCVPPFRIPFPPINTILLTLLFLLFHLFLFLRHYSFLSSASPSIFFSITSEFPCLPPSSRFSSLPFFSFTFLYLFYSPLTHLDLVLLILLLLLLIVSLFYFFHPALTSFF